MSLIIGHRGFSSAHLENSMEAFHAALAAGMNGFELDVQPALDGVCMVLHDDTLERTAKSPGVLRKLKSMELPCLKNGEKIPRLADALSLKTELINVELKGEPGWKQALAAVEASEALDRVLFSSFEHSEILQLWSQCLDARCGFLWEEEEADLLEAEELANLPEALFFHIPLKSALKRPDFWKPHAKRLVLWDMKTPIEAKNLAFEAAVLIVDGI